MSGEDPANEGFVVDVGEWAGCSNPDGTVMGSSPD